MLRECHALNKDLEVWKNDWGIEHVYLNPLSTRNAGQAILLKQNRVIMEYNLLLHGRIQVLNLNMDTFSLSK